MLIVNEAFAKKFNLGRNAVGKRMGRSGPTGKETLDIEIVGLVRDAKYDRVKADPQPVYFTPYLQDSTAGLLNLYIRTAGNPTSVLRAIPAVVARLDPNLPVEGLRPLPEQARDGRRELGDKAPRILRRQTVLGRLAAPTGSAHFERNRDAGAGLVLKFAPERPRGDRHRSTVAGRPAAPSVGATGGEHAEDDHRLVR